jgi:hypothetical protein
MAGALSRAMDGGRAEDNEEEANEDVPSVGVSRGKRDHIDKRVQRSHIKRIRYRNRHGDPFHLLHDRRVRIYRAVHHSPFTPALLRSLTQAQTTRSNAPIAAGESRTCTSFIPLDLYSPPAASEIDHFHPSLALTPAASTPVSS